MSSIEPVKLPEPAAWGLLAQQPVDPVYPDAARASGQRGSVVLQVLDRARWRGSGCEVPAGIAGICAGRHRRSEAVAIQALFHEWSGGVGAEHDHAELQTASIAAG